MGPLPIDPAKLFHELKFLPLALKDLPSGYGFHFINKEDYEQFQDFHMKRITYIVMPTMLIELLTGVYLILSGLGEEITFIISMILLGLIWLQTAIFFSRIHQKLTLGYQKRLVDSLVKVNWARTIIWSGRLIMLLLV